MTQNWCPHSVRWERMMGRCCHYDHHRHPRRHQGRHQGRVHHRRHRHQFSAVQGAAVVQVGPRHSGSGHTYGTDRCIQQQDLWTACGNTTHSRTASENSHTSTPAAAQANPPPMKCIVVSWLLLSRTVNAAGHPLPFVMQTRIVRGMCGIYAAFCSERGPEETSSQGSI
jgi:hypothetical protein